MAPAAEGLFPVLFFSGGLAANVPVAAYRTLLGLVVERGYVVVGTERRGVPHYLREGRAFLALMEWARRGLAEAMLAANLTATPDVGRAAVMGQSSGCHVVGEALKESCSLAQALVLLDPVDGYDPYRIITSQDLITPGQPLPFATPTLLLDNALDTIAVNPFFPPCMPPALGSERWYPAVSGPIWNIKAADYGHVDCLDDSYRNVSRFLCRSDDQSDKPAYRAAIAAAVTTFLAALFDGRQQDLALLESAGFGVRSTPKWDLQGLTHAEIQPGCSRKAGLMEPALIV